MVMQIHSEVLADFLSKVSMKGKVEKIYLWSDKVGLHASISMENSIFVKGILYREAFLYYEEGIEIGIKSVTTLLKILQNINDKIDVTIDNNYLMIGSDKRDVEYILASKEFIEGHYSGIVSFSYNKELHFSIGFFVQLNKNAVALKGDRVKFTVLNNELKVNIQNNSDAIIEKLTCVSPDLTCSFGSWLMGIFPSLTSEIIKVGLASNYPIRIADDEEGVMLVEYFVSPLIEDENIIVE